MRNRQNVLFIGFILIVCIVIIIISQTREDGAQAVVQFANGEAVNISLSKNGTHTLEKGELPIHLEVVDNKIRFINSECPDHVCENFGWLSQEGDQAICAPARASVTIQR